LSSERLVTAAFRGSWEDLSPLDLPPVVAVLAADHTEALRAVRSLGVQGIELLLASVGRADDRLRHELRRAGFALWEGGLLTSPRTTRAAVPGRVWLLTSGSTGRPKRVAHTVESLTTVGGPQPARRWLCPYSVGSYAWWQLVTLSLASPGQDLVLVEPDALDGWPLLAAKEGVTAASGTPTFWRRALWQDTGSLQAVPLAQITLGGEPVDQAVLDQLGGLFPEARISWIYASSEAGASIAVHDGRAGFPASWLDRAHIDVVDGELVLTSPHAASEMPRRIHTGDKAEVVEDRVHITGRLSSDEINVGGAKASAAAVREVLQSHANVQWAQVKGRKAPLVGALVAADVVLRSATSEAALTQWCAARLPDHAVPRRFRFLDEVPLKESLKSDV